MGLPDFRMSSPNPQSSNVLGIFVLIKVTIYKQIHNIMGKLIVSLKNQLKTEFKQDAEDCIKIYDTLKEMHNGSVWESSWTPLVKVKFYLNAKPIYSPTDIGRTFLNGLNKNKGQKKYYGGLGETNLYGIQTFSVLGEDDTMLLSGKISKEGLELLKEKVPQIVWAETPKGL